MSERQYLSVEALLKYIKRKFDVDRHLESVYVKGEVSNFKRHSSGHVYFTLKDEKAVINAVMFRSDFQQVKFAVENGLKILVNGNVTVYETAGTIQFYIKELKLDGVGDLFVAFEQLKQKLGAEGLFHPRHKQAIPKYPRKIAVISSPTGAAIRDILTTIKRRFPMIQVTVIPAIVQGKQSVESLVAAIKKANDIENVDVIIMGRGGGSIEDLWSFNDEKVARTIFASRIPIISAVGHETDVTIADYVADLRAPTPTSAAEMATPHQIDLLQRVQMLHGKILKSVRHTLQHERQRLLSYQRSYAFRTPKLLLQQKRQQLDSRALELTKALQDIITNKRQHNDWFVHELAHRSPIRMVKQLQLQNNDYKETLQNATNRFVQQKRQQFLNQYALLNAVDPLKIMSRGFSVLYDRKQNSITSITDVQPSDTISVKVTDGIIDCKVEAVRGD